jgi:hypothetical protein
MDLLTKRFYKSTSNLLRRQSPKAHFRPFQVKMFRASEVLAAHSRDEHIPRTSDEDSQRISTSTSALATLLCKGVVHQSERKRREFRFLPSTIPDVQACLQGFAAASRAEVFSIIFACSQATRK